MRGSKNTSKFSFRADGVAEATGLSVRKVRQLIATGELKSIRVGKCRLIRVETLQEFLAEREK